MNFDEHKSAVVGEAMGRRDGCCERDAAEGFDGVGVELFKVNSSLLIRDRKDCQAHLGDLHGYMDLCCGYEGTNLQRSYS